MDLIEKIDELRANSVTPERFERVCNVSIEQHLDEMMAWIENEIF